MSTQAPLCRPSLASIASGLYSFQHGITGNDVDGRNNRVELDTPLREKFHQHPSFIKLLSENGYQNTVVIFMCDNGWVPASMNADDPHQKLWNGFAQRSKGSPFENGIRTPILVSWPGQVKPARVPNLAHAIDIFPTIAAAAGLKAPADLPGINLLDLEARTNREIVFGVCNSIHNMTPGNPDGTLQYLWCVEKDWKLILRYHGEDTTVYRNIHVWDTEPVRLYNLKNDPQEKQELSSEHPEVVERLRELIEVWHPVGEK